MPTRKVLVVLSSEDKVTLNRDRAGSAEVTHATGFFLCELMVPLMALVEAGYEPVPVSPGGTRPVMDAVSDGAFWFGGDEKRYQHARGLARELGICGDELVGTKETLRLADARKQLDDYAGLFVPGGHAPMEDLYRDSDLGAILRGFHAAEKPTALICHAPIALLSALDDPAAFGTTLEELNKLAHDPKNTQEQAAALTARLEELAQNWIYNGYRMTSFSTKEEQQEEPGGADDVLGGYMKFYPDEALAYAGGNVTVTARKWMSHVVDDRELITGQNPFSDGDFAARLVRALG